MYNNYKNLLHLFEVQNIYKNGYCETKIKQLCMRKNIIIYGLNI